MGEWQRLFRRLRDRISPPTYPEYQEYRDDGDATRTGGTGAGVGGADDDVLKMRRVRMVGVLAVLLSLGAGAWLYFADRSDAVSGGPRLREALTSEMLKADGVDPLAGNPPQDSLDNIKRWASDLERRMERSIEDTAAPMVPPGARPAASYYGQGYDMNQPLVFPDAEATYRETDAVGVYGSVPASPPRAVATTTIAAAPVVPVAPAVAPPPASGTRSDSPENPYQRRNLEPVTYEPRNVDPY